MADKTALFESSQAWFSSYADVLGVRKSEKELDIEKYPTWNSFYSVFKKPFDSAYDRLDVGIKGATITKKQMADFLEENNDWYISSVLIAVELIKEIQTISRYGIKPPGYQNLFYFRGDEGVMGKLEKIFKIANKSPIYTASGAGQPFGDVNKWSPADIYLASKKAFDTIQEEYKTAEANKGTYTFISLNKMINSLIKDSEILPLSLKKTEKTAKLVKVNFDRKSEAKELEKITFLKTSDWKPYVRVPFGQKTVARDIRVFIQNMDEIKFRHDPSAKRFVVEYIPKIGSARGGSMLLSIFIGLMNQIDSKTAGNIDKAFNKGLQDYNKEVAPLLKLKDNLPKKQFDFERGAISATNIVNRVMPILFKWFNRKDPKSKKQINEFTRSIFAYMTSRSPNSGRFVIAK